MVVVQRPEDGKNNRQEDEAVPEAKQYRQQENLFLKGQCHEKYTF
jgi:hypothetical protein